MAIQNASSAAVLEDDLGGDDARPEFEQSKEGVTRDDEFLTSARNNYDMSTDFLEASVQKGWQRSIDHFNNKHASGSRYLTDGFRGRSRLFTPKTRSMVRRAEADCARAFFSTMDVVNIQPTDDSRPRERASAEINNAIINYRLTKRIPWFMVLQGQYQTAKVQGVCCSKQYWAYEEEEMKTGRMVPVMNPENGQPVLDEETGMPVLEEERSVRVLRDDLVIDPIPPENLRIHPGADWLDPIQKSPFVIYQFPMYVAEIKQRAKEVDPKTGQPKWRDVDPQNIASSLVDNTRSIREKREGGTDRFAQPEMSGDADEDSALVWVHENIVRKDGQDWHYYTLGTAQILSDPRPLKDVYFLDERPFTWGVGQIEAFRLYPQSAVDMAFDTQVRINHLNNLRLDNVEQVLHPKVLVKSQTNLDLRALTNERVGGAVMVNGDPNQSVLFVRPPDVTASAYQERNMLNQDFDDLTGTWSQSSIATNRQMNETVGGMNLLAQNSSVISEYELRIFAETWVEPTLRQCVKLVQKYETDETIIALAGQQANVYQRYGMDPFLNDLLTADLTVTVNVGIGSTNPEQRQARFMGAMTSLMQIAQPLVQVYGPQVLDSPGFEAITKEVMGSAGYKDGKRFLDFGAQNGQPQVPPELQQQIQDGAEQIQKLEQENTQLKTKALADSTDVQVKMQELALKNRDMDLRAEESRREYDLKIAELKLKEAEILTRVQGEAETRAFEAQRMDREDARAAQAAQAPPPVEAPREPDQGSILTAQAMQALAAALEKINSPRRLIRDPMTGAAMGVEPA